MERPVTASADASQPASHSHDGPPTATTWLALGGWLALSFSAAALGGWFGPDAWYASLDKPAWNPPNWIFGPVWSALYTLMAISAWLVWRRGGFARQRRALTAFLLQLSLNAAWSPLFFGLHSLVLSALEIVVLWVAILVTALTFGPVSRLAAALLLPYLAWVGFAAALNFALWRLNA